MRVLEQLRGRAIAGMIAPLAMSGVLVGCMETVQVPVQRQHLVDVPYKSFETERVPVAALFDERGLVVACTDITGAADAAALDRAIENGFDAERSAGTSLDVTYQPRRKLLESFDPERLRGRGAAATKILENTWHVNTLCEISVGGSGTGALSASLRAEHAGEQRSVTLSATGWEDLGREVARAFVGTRVETRAVTRDRTRREMQTYTEMVEKQQIDWLSTLVLVALVAAGAGSGGTKKGGGN